MGLFSFWRTIIEIFVGARPQFTDSTGQLVVNGSLYIGRPFQDPKLNPADIWSDEALTIPLQNPIRTDAYGRPTQQIYISGEVSYRLEDANGVLVEETGHCLGIGSGTGGTSPEPLQDRNIIVPISGNIIKNGVGTLTFESRRITSTGTFLNSGSSPKIYVGTTEVNEANGYLPGSDGFTAILGAGNINEKVTLELKSTPNGVVLDSADAVDVLDGLGSPNIFGAVEATNGLSFTRAPGQGAWSPTTDTQLVATFFENAAQVGQATVNCVLDESNGAITCSVTAPDVNISVNVTNNGTSTPYVLFRYTDPNDSTRIEYAAEQLYSVQGGDTGAAGSPPTRYQLVPPLGVQLLNGVNALGGTTLTLQIFRYDTEITQITTGTIQVYDESNTPLGYNPILTAADINGSALFFVKDGPTGPVLDTITLLDVADGVSSNETSLSVSPTAGLTFVRDTDGAWLPAPNFTDLICSVFQGGAVIAQETVRVTRDDTNGNLTAATQTDDANVTWVAINSGTRSLTIEFTHTPSGNKNSERVISVLDGTAGVNAITGSSTPVSIIQLADDSFTPASPTVKQLKWTRDGLDISTRDVQISYDTGGVLSFVTNSTAGESTELVSTTGIGTVVASAIYRHINSGAIATLEASIVANGQPGTPGAEAVQPSGAGLLVWQFVSDGTNPGVLTPSGTVQDRVLGFSRSGVQIATRTVRATINTESGEIFIESTANTGESTTLTITGNNSSSAYATVTHVSTGATVNHSFTFLDLEIGGVGK